jgi:hypothetical protein
MQMKLTKIGALAAVGCMCLFCVMAYAQQTLKPKRGTIWVSWEEDGHQWMVGALKEYASAQDDPGFVQTDFGKGYAVKVQGESSTGNGILFHNCCITNIAVGTNYTGTITVGTNIFKVFELLKRK